MKMRTLVKTGSNVYEEEPLKLEEWKQALVLGALVRRHGAPIRVSAAELMTLRGCTLHVEHHMYTDEIVIGLEEHGR